MADSSDCPEVREKHFVLLLTDAIELAKLANRKKGWTLEDTFSRASVLTSALTVECVANICLDKLAPKSFREDVDKLSPLTKLELYAQLTGKAVDRGRNEYAAVSKLKKLRDGMAHPKVKRYGTTVNPEKKGSFLIDDGGSSRTIRSEQAVQTLRTINEFFRYYFNDVLGLSREETWKFLGDELIVRGKTGNLVPNEPHRVPQALSGWGFEFDFMTIPVQLPVRLAGATSSAAPKE